MKDLSDRTAAISLRVFKSCQAASGQVCDVRPAGHAMSAFAIRFPESRRSATGPVPAVPRHLNQRLVSGRVQISLGVALRLVPSRHAFGGCRPKPVVQLREHERLLLTKAAYGTLR